MSGGSEPFYFPLPFASRPSSTTWSAWENKQFEIALVIYPEGTPNRWETIASQVPGKSSSEVFDHYQILLEDINAIESGKFNYLFDEDGEEISGPEGSQPCQGGAGNEKTTPGKVERKRGRPWSVQEHKNFLDGLKRFGKGDWRNISRCSVKTRTPTQVASHAQKYFMRLNSKDKETKRRSIHDTEA